MSNFSTITPVTQGEPGTAPMRFCASTPDALSVITTAGYLNDISHQVKANDIFEINYLDTSTFPLNTGLTATYGQFQVTYSSPNWSLVAFSA